MGDPIFEKGAHIKESELYFSTLVFRELLRAPVLMLSYHEPLLFLVKLLEFPDLHPLMTLYFFHLKISFQIKPKGAFLKGENPL